MQEELVKALLEPFTSLKPAVSSLPFKVPSDLYSALFRSSKVKEELTKSVDNNRPLIVNPEFCKALQASYLAASYLAS